nr:unnamed protein product [Callosobruchus analis]
MRNASYNDYTYTFTYFHTHKIGRTKFNIDPKFDFIGEGNRALVEKVKPNMFGPLSDKYPSIYPRGECGELPGWIVFDKQILTFDAFFQESLEEVKGSPFQIRKVKIYYFLEDGTIQVVEPKVENSGISQDPSVTPTDPYLNIRAHERDAMQPRKPNRAVDTLGKFLENDKKVTLVRVFQWLKLALSKGAYTCSE